MSKPIIEFVTFTLNDGVSREDFAAAARSMSAWVSSQPGFVRRRLSCTEDGTWLEHIEWASMADAKAAGKVRMEGKDYVMHDGDVVEFRFNV